MKRAIFLFCTLISLTLLHAQDEGLNNKPIFRNEYFTQMGVIKPFVSSWKYPSEAFTMTPYLGYSFHFGFRRFKEDRPTFFQFSVGRRLIIVDFDMKQEYVNELSPDYQVSVGFYGWQGITDINFGLGSRLQLNRFLYIQPAFIMGIATKGGYEHSGHISSYNRSNLDSTELEIESYSSRFSRDLGLSIELSLEAGVKLGKRHSIGLQSSFVQYGIGFGKRRSPIFNLHQSRYHIYNSQKSYELNTSLLFKGYSLAVTYHYRF